MLLTLASKLSSLIKDSTKDKEEKVLSWDEGYLTLVSSLVDVMLEFPEKPEGFGIRVGSPTNHSRVILVSGGMDSTIMWWHNRDTSDKVGLYVDFGQGYADKEIEAMKRCGIYDQTIIEHAELPILPEWKHIIPMRNFMLIALAEKYVRHEGEIWLGAVSGESAEDKGDKSELFFRLCEELIWRSKNKKVTIKTLKDKTKNEWLKLYLDATGDTKILDTITCYDGGDNACGKCQACVRKWIAMRYCGLETSGYFSLDPYLAGSEHIQKYKAKLAEAISTQDFSHYSKERAEQDLQVILDYEKSI